MKQHIKTITLTLTEQARNTNLIRNKWDETKRER